MHKRGEIIRRFIKVVYFLITIPCLWFLIFILKGEYEITKYYGEGWSMFSTYKVLNRWKYIVLLWGLVLGFILLTDLLRRIVSYITKWDFSGFIPYKKIFVDFWWWIIIGIAVFLSIYSIWSWYENHIISYCTSEWESLSSNGVCRCNETAEMVDGKCRVKRGIKETKILTWLLAEYLGSENIMLLEYAYLPSSQNKWIGILMKNPRVSKTIDEDLTGESYDISCPASVEWLINVSGDGYIFAFSKNRDGIKIDDMKKIPSPWEYFSYSYPLVHTKQNSYLYFWGEKPTSEMDGNRLVRQYVIQWRDFNGDWEFSEFALEGYFDGMCGFHDYAFVGYDKKGKKIIFYEFFSESWSSYRVWLSDSVRDQHHRWIIHEELACGNHWSEVYESRDRRYNSEKNVFEKKNIYTRKCTIDEI